AGHGTRCWRHPDPPGGSTVGPPQGEAGGGAVGVGTARPGSVAASPVAGGVARDPYRLAPGDGPAVRGHAAVAQPGQTPELTSNHSPPRPGGGPSPKYRGCAVE